METIDQAALRARFNPDGSQLRRQQLRMLDILLEVDRICKKHHIPYWLSSGTLIGAARHQGFIPWDDDLDIEMLWPDYKRLMKILPQELPDTMALQNQETDPNYYFFYAKVRDRRSLLEENNPYGTPWREQGIYIDIFPFYKQPLWIHLLSEKAQGHVYKIMRRAADPKSGSTTKTIPHDFWKVKLITRFNRHLFFPLLRALCRCCSLPLFGRKNRIRETYGLGIPYHDPRHLEDILPLGETIFEGHLLPVPHDMHAALTLKYGDYMRLPDINKINLHVGKLEIYE